MKITVKRTETSILFFVDEKLILQLPLGSLSYRIKSNETEGVIYVVTSYSYGGQIFILQKNIEPQEGSEWILNNVLSVDIRIWELIEGKPIEAGGDYKFGRYIYVVGQSDAGPNQGGIRELHPVYQPIAKKILDLNFTQASDINISKGHGEDILKTLFPVEFAESKKSLKWIDLTE